MEFIQLIPELCTLKLFVYMYEMRVFFSGITDLVVPMTKYLKLSPLHEK